jgi:hypothetical protein
MCQQHGLAKLPHAVEGEVAAESAVVVVAEGELTSEDATVQSLMRTGLRSLTSPTGSTTIFHPVGTMSMGPHFLSGCQRPTVWIWQSLRGRQ